MTRFVKIKKQILIKAGALSESVQFFLFPL